MNEFLTKQDLNKLNIVLNQIKKNNFSHEICLFSNSDLKLKKVSDLIIHHLFCQNNKECFLNFKNKTKCLTKSLLKVNNFPDFIEVGDYQNLIKKEEILKIIRSFNLSSTTTKGTKIYRINGVEKLTLSAANSLLKFLETNWKNVYAIFTTKNLYKVMDTIKSRCLNIFLKNENIAKEAELHTFINSFFKVFLKNNRETEIWFQEICKFETNKIYDFIYLFFQKVKYDKLFYNIENGDQNEKIKIELLNITAKCLTKLSLSNNLNIKIILFNWLQNINKIYQNENWK